MKFTVLKKNIEKQFVGENINRIDKISTSKLFYKRDLIAYFLVALVITALIVVFVVTPLTKPTTGFCVKKDGQTLLYFVENKVTVQSGYESLIDIEELDGSIIVTVYTNQTKADYNVLLFDLANKTAKVTQSTCSLSKDCCYSPAIINNGIIYCAPHGLSIEPIGQGGFTPPVTGGIR